MHATYTHSDSVSAATTATPFESVARDSLELANRFSSVYTPSFLFTPCTH